MYKKLSATRALITGASSGIGFACANKLAENGFAQIIITARTVDSLRYASHLIESRYPDVSVIPIRCDHANEKDVEDLTIKLAAENQIPDTVIANIGDNPVHRLGPRKSAGISASELLQTFSTNLVNTHILLAFLLKFFGRNGGRIALVGSQAFRYGVKGQLPYNVSKSALVGYKNTLVSEYGHKGVLCHLVNPGLVLNKRTETLRKKLTAAGCVSEAQVAECIYDTLFQTSQNGIEIDI